MSPFGRRSHDEQRTPPGASAGGVKLLTEDDLRINAQAADVARTVLDEAVVAACRCERVTRDQQRKASGESALVNAFQGVHLNENAKQALDGGLPYSFLLVVTETKIHAVEEKRDGADLVAGKDLKSWDREGFVAKQSSDPRVWSKNGVPDDRWLVSLYLPLEPFNREQEATARSLAAGGVNPAMPHRMMLAKDAASQKVIDAIVSKATPEANTDPAT
jgi:hypothetical protein